MAVPIENETIDVAAEVAGAVAPSGDGDVARHTARARANDVLTTLSPYRCGRWDPTTRVDGTPQAGEMWRTTFTPCGTGTLRLRWHGGTFDAQAWGDGADWLLASVPALTGQLDRPVEITTGHPAVLRAQHRLPGLRLGASGTLYHDLLPVIIAQRITGGEAVQQWCRLVRELGERAPGPNPELRTPPPPASLLGRPAWWYHRLGIEAKRAEALRTVGRHAGRITEWASLEPVACATKLALLPGIGQWTIGSVLGPSLGDPDSFAIGD
ncbi:MAG: hypothetical protein JWM12_2226, partial [Ilumatobacteraceae bacterium]|nr:hypothetical protein [Ilumatobacteraceae bacterium]